MSPINRDSQHKNFDKNAALGEMADRVAEKRYSSQSDALTQALEAVRQDPTNQASLEELKRQCSRSRYWEENSKASQRAKYWKSLQEEAVRIQEEFGSVA